MGINAAAGLHERVASWSTNGCHMATLTLYTSLHRRRPGGHAWVILAERAQAARFSGRPWCSQAGGRGSQVRVARHSHHACAEICPVLRQGAGCSRAPTPTMWTRLNAAC